MTMSDAVNAVEMRGITKRFGRLVALDNVSIAVKPQTIHAIVGENGAGKTTLMKVLQGSLRSEAGDMSLHGSPLQIHSAQQGFERGIGMVSQHYSIIPELTALQNLMLGAEPGTILPLNHARERAVGLAAEMGMEFDWDAEARTLSPARAQKLEILKLLWRRAEIMILDEPTAMLSPSDAEELYANLKELVKAGKTAIVVTHRLNEVLEHCDSITVLRGGKNVADRSVADTNASELAELIVGRALSEPPTARSKGDSAAVLEIQGLTALGHRGDEALREANFQLQAGEMVGLAGVDGSGQRELFHALMGMGTGVRGSVRLGGTEISGWSVRERLEAGVRLIAEDRHEEAVMESWSLIENSVLSYQRRETLTKGKALDRGAMTKFAEATIARFKTKCDSPASTMQSLSGGNQQRVVAARALSFEPKLILAFQPTRGLDIAGTQEVYAAIRAECEKGAAALVVSFDLDELLEHCDRVMAVNRGRLTVMPPEKSLDRAEIGRWMVVD